MMIYVRHWGRNNLSIARFLSIQSDTTILSSHPDSFLQLHSGKKQTTNKQTKNFGWVTVHLNRELLLPRFKPKKLNNAALTASGMVTSKFAILGENK